VNIFRWLWAIVIWTLNLWWLWMPLVVIAAVLFTTAILGADGERQLRYSGLILELLGVGTVVSGLLSKRQLFKKPSFWGALKEAAKAFPRWPATKNLSLIAGTGSLKFGGSARISAWHGSPTGASLEQRIGALEANLATVKQELEATSTELRSEDEAMRAQLEAERNARHEITNDLKMKLEGIGVEGLRAEAIGLVWLLVGVVFSTIPEEISKLI